MEVARLQRPIPRIPPTVLAHLSQVTIVVEAEVRDATGTALVAGARRGFRVGPAVRTRVDPEQWHVAWPNAGSKEILTVDFDRPLDHALALRCLRVTTADGHALPGKATLGPGEVRWSFTPAAPWPEGVCELHVNADLEDLAGNSVRRVFDRDLRLAEDNPLAIAEVVLSSEGGPSRPSLSH